MGTLCQDHLGFVLFFFPFPSPLVLREQLRVWFGREYDGEDGIL